MSLILENQPLPLQVDANGVIRVGGTRVTLDTVITSFQSGSTAEQIAQDYSVLELTDIYAVIAFYLRHREEVSFHLAEQRRQGEHTRQEMEARFDPQGIRDRLLARRTSREVSNGSASRG